MRSLLILTLATVVSVVAFAASSTTAVLDVKNMSCGTCPITVKKSLEKVAGVTEVRVDFAKKTATVAFDASKTNAASFGQGDHGRRIPGDGAPAMTEACAAAVGLTCPECGHIKNEQMPTNACQFFYERVRAVARPCCAQRPVTAACSARTARSAGARRFSCSEDAQAAV